MYLICLHNVIRGKTDNFDKKCSRIDEIEFEEFLDQCGNKFHLISFSEYLLRLKTNTPDPLAVALSFDDGFLGVYKYAAPILRKRGIDAALFLSPLYLGAPEKQVFHFVEIEIMFRLSEEKKFLFEGKEFPLEAEDRVRAMKVVKRKLKAIPDAERAILHEKIRNELKVTKAQILEYAKGSEKFYLVEKDHLFSLESQGWTIAPHGLSHRSLAWLPETEMRMEISESKKKLEFLLGHETEVFAYPYGEMVHVGERAPEICSQLGIKYSFTTEVGDNVGVENRQLLRRFDYKDFRKTKLS